MVSAMAARLQFGWVLALIALSGCRGTPAAENQIVPAPPGNGAGPVALPKPEPALDRAALLMAVVRARSAAAAGMNDAALQRELDGRRFEFRTRLGCTLAVPGTRGARATFDPEERRVEISARPDLTLEEPAVAAIAAGRFEAAEGFRVAAPWLLVPHCAGRGAAAGPAAPAAAEAAASPAGLVGLVQFFTAADPRSGRRDGRAYAARETLPEGSGPPAAGSWELVLSGRLQALPGGRVIACAPAGPGEPPACIVSVRFDRAAIVNRVTADQLAEWSDG